MLMWDKYENNIMDSWSESATVNLDAGETYEFQIRQDEKIGSYVLNIGFQKESVDLTNVTVLYDSIEYTDQKNVYTFTAHVAGRYHFELSEYTFISFSRTITQPRNQKTPLLRSCLHDLPKIAYAENRDLNLPDKDIPAVSRKSCERLIHLTVDAADRLHIDKAIS